MTILINVSQAISWTPSWVSCINSNSLLITVLRNFQWARKKRGYWPTIYMISDAITALLSLPLFCSTRPRRSKNCSKCYLSKKFMFCSIILENPIVDPSSPHYFSPKSPWSPLLCLYKIFFKSWRFQKKTAAVTKFFRKHYTFYIRCPW